MYLLTLYYDVVLMRGLQLAQGQGLQGAVELLSSEPKTEHLSNNQFEQTDKLAGFSFVSYSSGESLDSKW